MNWSMLIRRVAAVLAVLLLVLINSPLTGGAVPGNGLTSFEVVLELPVGKGPGRITVLPDLPGGVPRGPQALAVDEDGTIYVADSAGRQILVCDGQTVRTLATPWIQYARDLAVAGGNIYVLDVSDRVWVLDTAGEVVREVALPAGMTYLDVLRLVPAIDAVGELVLWCSNYIQFSLNDLPPEVDPQLWDKGGLEFSGVGRENAHSGLHRRSAAGALSIRLVDLNQLQLLSNDRLPIMDIEPIGGAIGSGRLVHMDSGQTYVLVEELGAPNPGVQVNCPCESIPGPRAPGPCGCRLRRWRQFRGSPQPLVPAGPCTCSYPVRNG